MSPIVFRMNLDSHQLDPGVNADGDRIHRFHKVPPMSGNIKHLKDREKNKEINLRRGDCAQFHRTAARWQQSHVESHSSNLKLSVIDSQQHQILPLEDLPAFRFDLLEQNDPVVDKQKPYPFFTLQLVGITFNTEQRLLRPRGLL